MLTIKRAATFLLQLSSTHLPRVLRFSLPLTRRFPLKLQQARDVLPADRTLLALVAHDALAVAAKRHMPARQNQGITRFTHADDALRVAFVLNPSRRRLRTLVRLRARAQFLRSHLLLL